MTASAEKAKKRSRQLHNPKDGFAMRLDSLLRRQASETTIYMHKKLDTPGAAVPESAVFVQIVSLEETASLCLARARVLQIWGSQAAGPPIGGLCVVVFPPAMQQALGLGPHAALKISWPWIHHVTGQGVHLLCNLLFCSRGLHFILTVT